MSTKQIFILIVVVVIALVLLGILLLSSKPAAPAVKKVEAPVPPEDSTAVINKDLEGLNQADLQNEFKDIDAAVNTL